MKNEIAALGRARVGVAAEPSIRSRGKTLAAPSFLLCLPKRGRMLPKFPFALFW